MNFFTFGIGAILMMVGYSNPSTAGWVVWIAGIALMTAGSWALTRRKS